MKTAASAPSVAVATGAVQNVGLPTVQNASSGPSVRRRKSRVATPNGGELRRQQDRHRGDVADADLEAPAREHGEQPDAGPELEPEEHRDVRQQPAARAEADDERAEERESCDHRLVR